MTRLNTTVFLLWITFLASSSFAQSVDALEEIKVCAAVTEQDARLACFDRLSDQVLQQGPADTASAQQNATKTEVDIAAATVVKPLPEDLGSSKVDRYAGTVTSCRKGQSGDWYFFFDNDQVWKHVSNRKLRFKECSFDVTITKDTFGYKMQIDGETRTIRVRRHR